jgi:hypothetical protein
MERKERITRFLSQRIEGKKVKGEGIGSLSQYGHWLGATYFI